MSEEDKRAIEDEENDDDAEMDPDREDDRRQNAATEGGDETEESVENVAAKKKKKERGFNTDCLINVWKKGKELIKEDNIKETREHKTRRYAREVKLMEAIGDLIKSAQNNKRNTRLGEEVEVVEKPAWLGKCIDVSQFS